MWILKRLLLQFNYWKKERIVTRSRERRLSLKREEIDRRKKNANLRRRHCETPDEKNVFYEKWFDSFFFSPFLLFSFSFSCVRNARRERRSHHRNFIVESRNRAKYMQISSRRSTGDTRNSFTLYFNFMPRIAI